MKVAELEAENASLREWKRLFDAAPPEAHEVMLERFRESEAVQPIVAVWKAKVAQLEQLLLEALYQGAHISKDGHIDTMHLSAWQDIAAYLTDLGVLVEGEHGYRLAKQEVNP